MIAISKIGNGHFSREGCTSASVCIQFSDCSATIVAKVSLFYSVPEHSPKILLCLSY